MDFCAKRFIVTAGLSGMLALSVMGCGGIPTSSPSNSSTDSSTSVSATDNTESVDSSEYAYYEIEALGFRCDPPEGFTFDSANFDIDKEDETVQAFQYSDAEGSNMKLQVAKVGEDFDESSDEYLNACLDEAIKALEQIGATINTKETGTMQLSNGKVFPAINLTYILNGIELEVTQVYVNIDGYLLTFTGTSRNSDVITNMFVSLMFK